MSKLNFLFLMTAGTCFSCPAWEVSALVASGTQTHTYGLELKPASFINTEKAFKTASICFLGVGDCDPDVGFSAGDDYSVDSEKQCLNEGFTKLNCNSVQTIDGVCPYNPAYGQHCKCRPNLISCPAGQVGVGDSCNGQYASCKCDPNLLSCASNQNGSGAYCGGRYQSCVCKPEYQYTSSNCSYPRSISGISCGGKYTGCICPSGVSSGAYGCAQYYPSPCSGVCKSAYSDNCRNRTAVSTPYGCAEYWSDCPSKCKTAYNDNCRNRTAASCPYGCASAFGDCQSKCHTCDVDPCTTVSAIKVPTNGYCASWSPVCPMKCSDWACNAGYLKKGSECKYNGCSGNTQLCSQCVHGIEANAYTNSAGNQCCVCKSAEPACTFNYPQSNPAATGRSCVRNGVTYYESMCGGVTWSDWINIYKPQGYVLNGTGPSYQCTSYQGTTYYYIHH